MVKEANTPERESGKHWVKRTSAQRENVSLVLNLHKGSPGICDTLTIWVLICTDQIKSNSLEEGMHQRIRSQFWGYPAEWTKCIPEYRTIYIKSGKGPGGTVPSRAGSILETQMQGWIWLCHLCSGVLSTLKSCGPGTPKGGCDDEPASPGELPWSSSQANNNKSARKITNMSLQHLESS